MVPNLVLVKNQNGAAMRAIRTAKKIGVRELARRIDRSHGFICNLEAERSYASTETLEAIAVAMDVPVAAITRNAA